jgi:hypothetical protein
MHAHIIYSCGLRHPLSGLHESGMVGRLHEANAARTPRDLSRPSG